MADFEQLLSQTSRTFGLSIPLLGEPHRHRLTLAYLLFRVADTLEDADQLPMPKRHQALRDLHQALVDNDASRWSELVQCWQQWQPSAHAGYRQLLGEFPALMAAIEALGGPANALIRRHACRTVEGMAEFVAQSDMTGRLQLQTLEELRRYCYVVAGIVGEMITDLFVTTLDCLQGVAEQLLANAAAFGEGLQLVNILKDATDDARQGRIYLPPTVPASEVFALARADLDCADRYIAALRDCQVGDGLLPFTELPIRLARHTLDRIEQCGAGAKLTRSEVAMILREVDDRFQSVDQLPAGLKAYALARSNGEA